LFLSCIRTEDGKPENPAESESFSVSLRCSPDATNLSRTCGACFRSDRAKQISLYEIIEFAVEDAFDVAFFDVCTVVLHKPVGLHDIGPDLIAPCDFIEVIVGFLHFDLLSASFALI